MSQIRQVIDIQLFILHVKACNKNKMDKEKNDDNCLWLLHSEFLQQDVQV